jgi:hypothetical protein
VYEDREREKKSRKQKERVEGIQEEEVSAWWTRIRGGS